MDLRSRLARLVIEAFIFLYLVALSEIDPDASPALKHPLNDGIYVKDKKSAGQPGTGAVAHRKTHAGAHRRGCVFSRKKSHEEKKFANRSSAGNS